MLVDTVETGLFLFFSIRSTDLVSLDKVLSFFSFSIWKWVVTVFYFWHEEN